MFAVYEWQYLIELNNPNSIQGFVFELYGLVYLGSLFLETLLPNSKML